jgi:hypothetical protein
VPITGYRDLSATGLSRIVAPAGQIRLLSRAIVNDAGNPDPICTNAIQHAVQDLPEEALVFLLASRYCETDHLSAIAWSLFSASPLGWARVQAICDFCLGITLSRCLNIPARYCISWRPVARL